MLKLDCRLFPITVLLAFGCARAHRAGEEVFPDPTTESTFDAGPRLPRDASPPSGSEPDAAIDASADGGRDGSVPPPSLLRLAVGPLNACVQYHDGVFECWGASFLLEGLSEFLQSSTPVQEVVFGLTHGCLRSDGRARCWGQGRFNDTNVIWNDFPGVETIFGAEQFTAGVGTLAGVTADGHVLTWEDTSGPRLVSGVTAARQVSRRASHGCVVQESGDVQCWGLNTEGQLGRPPAASSEVVTLSGLQAAQVVTGINHACARLRSGEVECWGSFGAEQPGSQHRVRQRVDGLDDVVWLASGTNHMCALTEDARVACWGHNTNAQLGGASRTTTFEPRLVPGIEGIVEMDAAGDQTCVLTESVQVLCWGGARTRPTVQPLTRL